MAKRKTVRIPLDISVELKEKIQKDSKDLFGHVNVNGFIKFLINNYESKSLQK
jgi:hypothetical protein